MAIQPGHVWTPADACKEFPNLLKRFRKEGIETLPMVVGSYGVPEAVVIPHELYERIATIIEDREIAELVRERSTEAPAEPMDELFARFNVELPRE